MNLTVLAFTCSVVFSILGLLFMALGSPIGFIMLAQGVYLWYLGLKNIRLDKTIKEFEERYKR